MKKLRLLLLPFSWIYGSITALRNVLYDTGILKTYTIPNNSICVGNLSVGGTGKTPHVDLIAGHFISQHKSVATLSRGYGRSTEGLLEATQKSTAAEIGDEPLLYKSKYGKNLRVIVSEKRIDGVKYIQKNTPNNTIILLDDAFQHRAVKAGLNIIITEYSNLFIDDFHLPAGNLREWKSGIKRADIIIVSKCPVIESEEKEVISNRLNFDPTKIFFSHIDYGKFKGFSTQTVATIKNILLVTGIGNPAPLLGHLNLQYNVMHLRFKDHHAFTPKDIAEIHEKFDSFASHNKIILTTEKDYVRLRGFSQIETNKNHWFYQPITTIIDELEEFNLLLDEHVKNV